MDTAVVITDQPPREVEVVSILRDAGWEVLVRRLAETSSVPGDRPDVVVVDVPDDGDFAQWVTEAVGLPLRADVAVVAVVDIQHVHRAVRMEGLTDFVVRPLRAEEVRARVRRSFAGTARDASDRIRLGDLVLDLKGYEVNLRGVMVDLTFQEFELLKFLACHPGEAFSRSQLLARVWGYDYYGGSRTVDIHVRRIRAKLGGPYAACLQTIRHVGYKWSPSALTGSDSEEK